MPTSATPPHSFNRAADLAGFAAVVPIFKGEAITQNVVSSSPDQLSPQADSFLPIPAGIIAITLPTGELQGVAGYPQPQDFLNIIATLNTGLFSPRDPRVVTDTVFTSVRIIRVGAAPAVAGQAQVQGVASSLTVLMTQCDAQFMDWLITNATLKYVLLSYKDTSPGNPQPTSSCPSTSSPGVIGPAEVDSRWNFTKG